MKKKFKFNRLLIICIVIYVISVFINKQQTLYAYKKEAANYSELIVKEQEKNAELQEIKNNIDSTEFIEQIARDKLEMYLPNERVYIDISK